MCVPMCSMCSTLYSVYYVLVHWRPLQRFVNIFWKGRKDVKNISARLSTITDYTIIRADLVFDQWMSKTHQTESWELILISCWTESKLSLRINPDYKKVFQSNGNRPLSSPGGFSPVDRRRGKWLHINEKDKLLKEYIVIFSESIFVRLLHKVSILSNFTFLPIKHSFL